MTVPYRREKVLPIQEVLDDEPVLNDIMLRLLHWCSRYYQSPPGETAFTALPALLKLGKPLPETTETPTTQIREERPLLNPAQQTAVDTITGKSGFSTYLLDGVTNSGKTEVYLRAIEHALSAGLQALLLLPEIGLTPQNLEQLRQRFSCTIAVIHSRRTRAERLRDWNQARTGQAALVVGMRSAVWTPLARPGLIVVDEEHDSSFKQQTDNFRYSARDVAVMRAKMEDVPLVLGSATPSFESLFNVERKRYRHVLLPHRIGQAELPTTRIVDMRQQRMHGALSADLILEMRRALDASSQVLLFLGRRGYSPVLLCHHCGYQEHCLQCDAHMTFHTNPDQLRCHHCQASRTPPNACEKCGDRRFIRLGYGTQRIEESLRVLFPDHDITRVDSDQTKRRGALESLINKVHKQQPGILVGTQMLAKGHDIKNISLIGIVDLDRGLYSQNFRSLEMMAQQIVQVAGRAGRSRQKSQVLLQTHYPDHPTLQILLAKGYAEFARLAMSERRITEMPPYARMALLQAEGKKPQTAGDFFQEALDQQPNAASDCVRVLGPYPASMTKRSGYYREQLILLSREDGRLQTFLQKWLPRLDKIPRHHSLRWFVDIDPLEAG